MPFSPLPTTDAWVPQFQLYDSTGTSLIYTFYAVDDTNIPQQPVDTVTITNFRSSGAVVIGGGNKPFEGFLHFYITGSGYTAVQEAITYLTSNIQVNVPYILQVGTGSSSAPLTYNVKRIVDFEWLNVKTSLRNYYQEVNLKLLCNAW